MMNIAGPPYTGLSTTQARDIFNSAGPNEIQQEQKKPAWVFFLDQFKSPLVLILLLACVLSMLLGQWPEAIAITGIVLINAGIGFLQEYRAENAILALQKMTAPKARVLRDGYQTMIPARDVVPGDILVLEAGDIISADGVILESAHLKINEAVLTGESFPVEKSAAQKPVEKIEESASAEMSTDSVRVYMGTAVATGTATTRVIATGMSTQLGKIAHLITTAQTSPTPLQQQLTHLGRMLLVLCLTVVCVVAALGLAQGRTWLDLIVFSISLAVAVVPEGMPAIVTVALALGIQRMALRNALIRKLPSVETLGSVTVICTDKTGTLTTGNMRVRELWGADHSAVLYAAASCCDAQLSEDGVTGAGDPTEVAILIAAKERGILKEDIEIQNPRVETQPFDPDKKRMSILRQDRVRYVKGALEVLIPLCTEDPKSVEAVERANEDMTSRGLRVLAVVTGSSDSERPLRLQGLVGIADPPRTEAAEAIKEARAAGVVPIMITGDHPITAASISRELGLVLEGEALDGRVHARSTPEDKLNLVREWKAKDAIVAMTGDGVNDAPALREAHIGIAMGKTGTEVTRQSADLILADDNFATIIAAVKEGRGVYQNIRKAIIYLLTGNFAELAVVFAASAFGLPVPLTAAHLLWINLVTDALPGLALIADPVSSDVMRRPPRPVKEKILGKREWNTVMGVGVIEAAVVMCLFIIDVDGGSLDHARSLAFTTLVLTQIFRSVGARSEDKLFFEVGVCSNLWLIGVIVLSIFLQLILHYIPLTQDMFALTPLSMQDLVLVFGCGLVPVTVIELVKLIRRIKPTAIGY